MLRMTEKGGLQVEALPSALLRLAHWRSPKIPCPPGQGYTPAEQCRDRLVFLCAKSHGGGSSSAPFGSE